VDDVVAVRAGRQVHVEQELHARSIVTSCSSLRDACRGERFVDVCRFKIGIGRQNSAAVQPTASNPTIVPTVTLSPPMQGFPPMIAGTLCDVRQPA
jgi:hypothetical protein